LKYKKKKVLNNFMKLFKGSFLVVALTLNKQ